MSAPEESELVKLLSEPPSDLKDLQDLRTEAEKLQKALTIQKSLF